MPLSRSWKCHRHATRDITAAQQRSPCARRVYVTRGNRLILFQPHVGQTKLNKQYSGNAKQTVVYQTFHVRRNFRIRSQKHCLASFLLCCCICRQSFTWAQSNATVFIRSSIVRLYRYSGKGSTLSANSSFYTFTLKLYPYPLPLSFTLTIQ